MKTTVKQFRKALREHFSKMINEDQDRVRRHEDGYGDDMEESFEGPSAYDYGIGHDDDLCSGCNQRVSPKGEGCKCPSLSKQELDNLAKNYHKHFQDHEHRGQYMARDFERLAHAATPDYVKYSDMQKALKLANIGYNKNKTDGSFSALKKEDSMPSFTPGDKGPDVMALRATLHDKHDGIDEPLPTPPVEAELDEAEKPAMTRKKAKTILKHGHISGKPLTKAQKGLFGLVAGGDEPKKTKKKEK
jgi:hypothetical protein